jgi:hypothetical protein
VNELDGAGGSLNLLLRATYGAGGSEQQRRPDAFAAAEDAVSHRFVQTGRYDLRSGKPRS